MKWIQTQDGSLTLHSEQYDETLHSLSGAKEEAIKKYVEPCMISGHTNITILDICFGLGYNSAAALDARRAGKTSIVAIENDETILQQVLNMDYPFSSHEMLCHAIRQGSYEDQHVSLQLVVGDVRSVVPTLPCTFDAVFFDPFSPKKCPELWTTTLFAQVFRVMKPGAVLATYSCARSVREAMISAGFHVRDGPCVGRKSPATIAIKPSE
ncbi:hypothetical protein GF342_03915 [Candidatus Woesearchaeota archaeon]|nr:hypothetical protein [Candidatus Woesearchaeota archaeon]